jgi:hypothetical protein
LGLSCWQRPTGPAWLRWLLRPLLAVYETEDESLLLLVRRVWALACRWQVSDANAQVVGTIWPRTLLWPRSPAIPPRQGGARPSRNTEVLVEDRWERFFALTTPTPTDSSSHFLGPDGSELGSLRGSAAGSLLTFGPQVEANPFTRMLLLAAVLVRSE